MNGIAVVGGGAVGLSFALAAHHRRHTVQLWRRQNQRNGERYFALNGRALAFLRELGVNPPTVPVTQFNLYALGKFLPLNATLSRPLCHIVAETALLNQLEERFAAAKISTGEYEKILRQDDSDHTVGLLVDGARINADLLAIADGSRSPLAAQSGIFSTVSSFGAQAIAASFDIPSLAPDSASQWFGDNDTIGLLPIGSGRFCLIWSTEQEIADTDITECLKQRTNLPECQIISEINRFPLYSVRAAAAVGRRTAILGDALQTIHPLAGQGLNLGLRNADCLSTCLRNTDAGIESGLLAYAATAQRGVWMDTLTKKIARASGKTIKLALTVATLFPPIKTAALCLAND